MNQEETSEAELQNDGIIQEKQTSKLPADAKGKSPGKSFGQVMEVT